MSDSSGGGASTSYAISLAANAGDQAGSVSFAASAQTSGIAALKHAYSSGVYSVTILPDQNGTLTVNYDLSKFGLIQSAASPSTRLDITNVATGNKSIVDGTGSYTITVLKGFRCTITAHVYGEIDGLRDNDSRNASCGFNWHLNTAQQSSLSMNSAAVTADLQRVTAAYTITGNDLPFPGTVDFYWAKGPNLADRIGASLRVPTATKLGSYSIVTSIDNIGPRPANATYILAVADSPYANHSRNVVAVLVPKPFIGDLLLNGFGTADSPNVLAVKYKVDPTDGSSNSPPFAIGFYSSADGIYTPDIDMDTGFRVVVSPASIQSNPNITGLLGSDGSPEPAEAALTPGEHTLLLRPVDTGLGAGIENPSIENLLAVIDPGDAVAELDTNPFNEDNTTDFRGYYQASTTSRGVIRTGLKSFDGITMQAYNLFDVYSAAAPKEAVQYQAKFGDPSDVLIMTSDLVDVIIVAQGAAAVGVPLIIDAGAGDDVLSSSRRNDILKGGPGNDRYIFGDVAGGIDQIIDNSGGDGSEQNTLDFSGQLYGVNIDIGSAAEQTLNLFLKLTISDREAFTTVIGTDFRDAIRGNTRVNYLLGGDGDDEINSVDNDTTNVGDALVGGLGNDTLTGSGGDDLLVGDDFKINSVFDFDAKLGVLEKLLKFDLHLGVSLDPIGNGDDLLYGLAGTDFLIGGLGNDYLDGGSGGGVIFGDAFTVRLGPEVKADFKSIPAANKGGKSDLKLKNVWKAALDFFIDFGLVGEDGDRASDTMLGGSGIDVMIGGVRDDTISSGGGVLDVIFGNDGDDTIRSSADLNLLIGGEGNDSIDASGNTSAYAIILGDDIDFFSPDLELGFDLLAGFTAGVSLGGLRFLGNGNDTLIGSQRGNFIVGGSGDDTIFAGDSFGQIVFGDAFVLDATAKFTFNATELISLKWENAFEVLFPSFGLEGTGNDSIFGGASTDLVIAGAGNDLVRGNKGFDILYGGEGVDTLIGGTGSDYIHGGAGDDFLDGSEDADYVFGDDGRDHFRFNKPLSRMSAFERFLTLKRTDYKSLEDLEY